MAKVGPGPRLAAFAAQALAGTLLAVGIFGLVARDVSLETIFPGYAGPRMSAGVAAACALLGTGLLALIARSRGYERAYAGRADERILILVVGILCLALVGVGSAALAILQRHIEDRVSGALLDAMGNRATILESVFANRATRASIIGTRPTVKALLGEWEAASSPGLRTRLREEGATWLASGFRGVVFHDGLGRPVAEAGSLVPEPALEVPVLGQRAPTSLLWSSEGFVLRTRSPVERAGRIVGTVVSEQVLELLPKLHFEVEELGRSAEWVLCARLGQAMGCFPQRFSPHPRVLARNRGEEALPIDLALEGRRGVVQASDYRGARVIAAHGPVGSTGLGVVLKIDAEEYYAPLRQQLGQWLRWFLAMTLLGALLVASQVRPVAQRLVRSEGLARRRAEALARSEAEVKRIWASMGDGVMVFSPEGLIEFLNPAAERLFGYPPGELVGRPVASLVPEALRGANERATRRYLEAGASSVVGRSGMVYPARRRDGTVVEVEFSISEMRQEDRVRLVGVVRDVSERAALDRMKAEFVATVSHELRTPLTAIVGSLELAAECELREPERGFVEMARRNSARLAALVNDVIDDGRIASGALSLEMRDFDPATFLAEAVELNQPFAARHGVTIALEPASGLPDLHADRGRLMQVMANLLSNAAKFSPEGGEVRVRAEATPGGVRVEVADRGRGIPEEFTARVFERFAQADGSDSREKGGSGLGLAIAREIVERHEGAIGFDSRPGEGSTFWFELPSARRARKGS